MSKQTARDFVMRIPARFLKDAAISVDAKALRAVLGAYADGRTGRAYVRPGTLEKVLGWGRRRRESAQRELVKAGWLGLGWRRAGRGRWGRRVYILAAPSQSSEVLATPSPPFACRKERATQHRPKLSLRHPPLRVLSAAAKTRTLFIDHDRARSFPAWWFCTWSESGEVRSSMTTISRLPSDFAQMGKPRIGPAANRQKTEKQILLEVT
jgi:hypothetical protein